MHNSQNGADVNSDAIETLLVNDCVGCHSSDTSSTTYSLGGSTVPVVHYTGGIAPAQYLAGGNFWWVKESLGGDDSKGHNVFLNEGDEALSGGAPGKMTSGCGSNSCHDNLHMPAGKQGHGDLEGKYGCQGCHLNVAHHANDGSSGAYKLVTTAEQGWYRFLSGHQGGDGRGVKGGEDPYWQAASTSSVHNEYLGKVDSSGSWGFSGGSLGNTTTAFCTGCHGLFHSEQTSVMSSL